MILEGDDWKDKFVSLGNNETKAQVMSNSIFMKLSDKMKQDGRTDQDSVNILKKICQDVCINSIQDKGADPVNQVWFQRVEDRVLRDFSHVMSSQFYNDGYVNNRTWADAY